MRIKISDPNDPSIYDISEVFRTEEQYFSFTSPYSGANYSAGDEIYFDWDQNNFSDVAYEISFSFDDGATWEFIDTLFNMPYYSGSQPWTIPGISSDECRIKLHLNYAVEISDKFSISNAVSAEDVSQNQISLFPNPTTGVIQIKGGDQIERLNIYSKTGELVFTKQENFNSLNLSNLPAGIYQAEIFNGDTYQSQKLVIIK